MIKKLSVIGAVILFAAVTVKASEPWDTIEQFFANNPSNSWDVSTYGIYNNSSDPERNVDYQFGAGMRIQYAITPVVGAAFDVSYLDSSWTFASLGVTLRGTMKFGGEVDITPYVTAGPGWNINGQGQSIVAVAGGGATIDIKRIKWFKFFGEYQHVTTETPQNRVMFGITKSF